MKCVVGKWLVELDEADTLAFTNSINRISRAELYATICAAEGERPYGLTALKDHLNHRCVCFKET